MRRPLSAEHQAIADNLAAVDRLVQAARLDSQVRLSVAIVSALEWRAVGE